MIRNLVSAEGVKMCQTLCHLASLVPDPDVATSDVSKSVRLCTREEIGERQTSHLNIIRRIRNSESKLSVQREATSH